MLERAKLTVGTHTCTSRMELYAVCCLQPEFSTSYRREEYCGQLELQLQDRLHNDNDTSEQTWEALEHSIVTAAEER